MFFEINIFNSLIFENYVLVKVKALGFIFFW